MLPLGSLIENVFAHIGRGDAVLAGDVHHFYSARGGGHISGVDGLELTDVIQDRFKLLGPVTPIGGLLLMSGWGVLALGSDK